LMEPTFYAIASNPVTEASSNYFEGMGSYE